MPLPIISDGFDFTAAHYNQIVRSLPQFDARNYELQGLGANDTTPLQEAINAAYDAGGGYVRVPGGRYIHTGLQAKQNVMVCGVGKFATELAYPVGTGFPIEVVGPKAGFSDLMLTANPASDHVVEVNSATRAADLSWFRSENVAVSTFGVNKAAYHLKGNDTTGANSSYFSYFSNPDVLGSGAASGQLGIFAEDGVMSATNRGRVVGGNVRSVATGIHLDSQDGWTVDINNYEFCGRSIKLTGSASRVCQANTFVGGVSEGAVTLDVDIGTNCNDNLFLNVYGLLVQDLGTRNSFLPNQQDGRFRFGLGLYTPSTMTAVAGMVADTITPVTVGAGVTLDGAKLVNGGAEFTSTTKAVRLPRMTTAQRDAMTPANGDVIYNTTLNKFQGYENGAWTNWI